MYTNSSSPNCTPAVKGSAGKKDIRNNGAYGLANKSQLLVAITRGKIWKSEYQLRVSVRPHGATRLPLDGFSWNFLCESTFIKFVYKIQVRLKFNKNNEYCTWIPQYIYGNISLNYSQTKKRFIRKLQTRSKHTLMYNKVPRPPENRAV